MSTIKKRQHYVWRHYLKPWTVDKKIWTFFPKQNKIERPALMGVGQEKFFYELIDFTEEEEAFLIQFINKVSTASTLGLNMDFLEMFTLHYKLREKLENHPTSDKSKIDEQINHIQKNMMENVQGHFELYGEKLISCRTIEDLNFLKEADNLSTSIIYLMFQYFRTKK